MMTLRSAILRTARAACSSRASPLLASPRPPTPSGLQLLRSRAGDTPRLGSAHHHHPGKRSQAPAANFLPGRRTLSVRAASAEAQEPEVDDRIPVTIITGFLGSGKTTLLNHILTQKHGRRIAVIENEFGEIDIDSELVAKQEVLEGTNDTVITQLANGCLCCTVRDDLIRVLNKLWRRRKDFDHIVIETTGLANPAPIISSFYMDPDLPDRVRLDGVVTVVDAKHVERHLDEEKEKDVVNEAVEQVAYADRIVLNKTDLVDAKALSALEARLRAINGLASMQRAQRAVVPVDYVLGIGGFDLNSVEKQLASMGAKPKPKHDHHHGHDHDHHHHDPDHKCGPECKEHGHHHHHHDHGDNHDHAHASSSHDDHHHHHHDHEHGHDHGHQCGPDCQEHGHSHDHEEAGPATKHDDKVTSVSLTIEGDMDLDKINYSLGLLLQTRSEDIFRMKGILAIADSEFRFVYQGVHMMFEGNPDRKWLPEEPRRSRMVFIGRDLDAEAFREAFTNCLAKPKAATAGKGAPGAAGSKQ